MEPQATKKKGFVKLDQPIWDPEVGKNIIGYRIRKLTPREALRLMDVGDPDITTMMQKDEKGNQIISNSKLYALAGNSIVVNVMAELFRKLFIDTEDDSSEPTLF